MSGPVSVRLELPGDRAQLRLPAGVRRRLDELLEKQDRGEGLSDVERAEAEGLSDLNDLVSLLRLRAERPGA